MATMRELRIVCGMLALAACLTSVSISPGKERDLKVAPKVEAGDVAFEGEYWALIIGIDHYQHAPALESAVKDAKGVRDVLIERYGFKQDHIVELLNAQATRLSIESALYKLGRQAGKADSVLIYYAGHGQYDEEGRLGWWVPVEGEPKEPGTFITNASIRDYISGMKAKHVYLVADSCFSGTLFGSRALPPINDQWIARLYQKQSRWGLTSGGKEPVADQGKDGHSVFAYHFIRLLKENSEPYLVPSQIHTRLAPLVANNAEQTPRSEPLRGAGDEGGQFVFRLASVSSMSATAPSPSAALSQAEQQLKALEDQERRQADQQRLAEIQAQIEDKKKKLETAKAFPLPQQAGKEVISKDGAPMVLITAGEFSMGSVDGGTDEKPVHHVYLDAYYIDKFEVTTDRYAKFLQEVGAEAPKGWEQATPVSFVGRPVVGVDWGEAMTYCKWAGKRLPTEAEWEKAARGADGRAYPWGNDPPTRLHANFGKDKTTGYSALLNVGKLEEGKSPYGVYDMAGNVWEWTADWYGADYFGKSPTRSPTGPESGRSRVVRGGAWNSQPKSLRATTRDYSTPGSRDANLGFRCAKSP